MAQPQLIAFVDPMCSWCYGFQPVLAAIRQVHGDGLPVRLIMGGLRPGTSEPMSAETAATIREHWQHVEKASGQSFDFSFFDRPAFIYDTEPAARAVVTVRMRDEALALPYFEAVQRAFYAANQDVTNETVLAAIADSNGMPAEEFIAAFNSEEAQTETMSDFMIAQRVGATGFPTLIAGRGDGTAWTLITEGYQSPARVLDLIEMWRHN